MDLFDTNFSMFVPFFLNCLFMADTRRFLKWFLQRVGQSCIPYRVYALVGLVLGEEVEVALVDFDMDFLWVFLNFLGMQWVAMVNGGSGLVLSSEHDGGTVGDSVGSSSSSSQSSTMRECKGRNKLEVSSLVTH